MAAIGGGNGSSEGLLECLRQISRYARNDKRETLLLRLA